ncbi:hypothetical protein G7K_2048-t1 [Saitoella complicata NRRL Y-17804]|uniref:Uncharacterized protein n=1 Tax=Saitoella complicata (strain BCRC 22490 / CBS 7301 / JCM 7358 / NBRC 10748 / NRRL Y-17804) TaxID=698492 RepID=A0A0E9NDB9_SAICN|nr:hypothetical protein G7K_2048-t1 [Saitoella complicata NRRL Y-17804]
MCDPACGSVERFCRETVTIFKDSAQHFEFGSRVLVAGRRLTRAETGGSLSRQFSLTEIKVDACALDCWANERLLQPAYINTRAKEWAGVQGHGATGERPKLGSRPRPASLEPWMESLDRKLVGNARHENVNDERGFLCCLRVVLERLRSLLIQSKLHWNLGPLTETSQLLKPKRRARQLG